ncbi:GNAT family N-acetyltransferase [Sphingomonas glacialis]|uniref:N-acetyltransferase n=1 Tax=Sphingomonas glacialis TaxID=658225 RepID=A0A502FYD7_9SPHN|nr:GNAT family N-acetyltransferase [Sphingomonas glacialis]TPG54545.1 N-acetyltransferase [Sphingomonas glacialis]
MIQTERLILRPWRRDDLPELLEICRDPRVMATIGPPQDEAQVAAAMARQQADQAQYGYCYWAMEHCATAQVIGFCGLELQRPPMPIAGRTDIGWRLAHARWGQGYAREAALACLYWAWTHTPLDEIVAITVPSNTRSWGLMERLGMTRVADADFDHPDLAAGDPLRRHILYRIDRPTA